MIDMLWGVAGGLDRIHGEEKVHGNISRKKRFLRMLVLVM
jgi:hypothetical protein